jgi:hypothetical protein
MSATQKQQTLDRIDRIESPVARRVIRKIAEGMYAGRLSGEDMELLACIAERMSDRSESSLNPEEHSLVTNFRRLTDHQRTGAMMLLSPIAPN